MADEKKLSILSIERRLDETVKKVRYLGLIPQGYRHYPAVTTMKGFLNSGRADTWKECTALYEEQVHRWKLEQNSAEALQWSMYTAMQAQQAAKSAGFAQAVHSALSGAQIL